jgi:predicted kinase
VDIADAWVVAGPPGAGKTTVARILVSLLSPHPALLDKDTMYSGFVAATLEAAQRPYGEREGPWYDDHVKVHEYSGMTAVAMENRELGCAVVLCGPFTQYIHDAALWQAWVERLGGAPVRLVWVRSDPASLRHRLEARARRRDSEKLRRFDEFAARMRLDREPAVEHVAIDNRVGAPASIETQLRTALGLRDP